MANELQEKQETRMQKVFVPVFQECHVAMVATHDA